MRASDALEIVYDRSGALGRGLGEKHIAPAATPTSSAG
jgi:hypothetical protein